MGQKISEMGVVVLDGPMGTRLEAMGVSLDGAAWSARAVVERPQAVAEVHSLYSRAGASVHTAATFRATRPALAQWAQMGGPDVNPRTLVEEAVSIARGAVAPGHLVAGSMASVADCYRPSEVDATARLEHRVHAENLARAGVDLLLCETFANEEEAVMAAEEAMRFGLPVWLSLSFGPRGDLLAHDALVRAAIRASEAGVEAVLVNCSPAARIAPIVQALAARGLRTGAYANAGSISDGLGWLVDWGEPAPTEPQQHAHALRYVEAARGWVDLGATIVGGCCGTSEHHVRALVEALADRPLT